jgi:hypothetical protein
MQERKDQMTTSVLKLFVIASIAAVFMFATAAFAADAETDPVSGLPLYPTLHPSNDPIALTICNKAGQGIQYFPRNTVAESIDWYKAHLPGFHLYHAAWDDRSQDTFWSSDGTKGLNITGTAKSDRTFSVMYLQMKTGLTNHERSVFSPSNPTCK